MRRALALACLLAACGDDVRSYEDAQQVLEKVTIESKQAGKMLWELHAERSSLLEDRGLMKLNGVAADIYEQGRKSAALTAAQGTMDTTSKQVELETDVVLRSLKDSTVLRTDRLSYLPGEQRIRTEAPFKLDRPDAVIEGEGLEATPDLSTIRIFKHRTRVQK